MMKNQLDIRTLSDAIVKQLNGESVNMDGTPCPLCSSTETQFRIIEPEFDDDSRSYRLHCKPCERVVLVHYKVGSGPYTCTRILWSEDMVSECLEGEEANRAVRVRSEEIKKQRRTELISSEQIGDYQLKVTLFTPPTRYYAQVRSDVKRIVGFSQPCRTAAEAREEGLKFIAEIETDILKPPADLPGLCRLKDNAEEAATN